MDFKKNAVGITNFLGLEVLEENLFKYYRCSKPYSIKDVRFNKAEIK